MQDRITKEHVFTHPIEKVWDAITRAEEISSWFIDTDFKAQIGYQYTFNSKGETVLLFREKLKKRPPTVWFIPGL